MAGEAAANRCWVTPKEGRSSEASPGVSFEHMSEQMCGVKKMRDTATGQVPVECTKPAGHVAAGDLDHEGKTGVFPLKWRD